MLERGVKSGLHLYRLLAAFVRETSADGGAQRAVERVLLAEANRLNNAGSPRSLLAWQPHLRRVTDAAQVRGGELGAGLCNTLGYHLHTIGEYEAARPYYERALAIREKENKSLPRYLPEADYRRLEATVLQETEADTYHAYFDRACFLTLAHIGLRLSELLDFRLADLNLSAGFATIRGSKPGRG